MNIIKKILVRFGFFFFLGVSQVAFSSNYPWSQSEQCASWEINYNKAIDFSKKIQLAIREDDKDFLADVISYPLTIYKKANGKIINYHIENKKDFIASYRKIMTKDFKIKVLKYNPSDVFCNYHGGSFSGGGIWFQGDPLRIFEINK